MKEDFSKERHNQCKKTQPNQENFLQPEESPLAQGFPGQGMLDGGFGRQVDLLHNSIIPIVHRRTMAAQIGNNQGNLRLHRLINSMEEQSSPVSQIEHAQETMAMFEKSDGLVQRQSDAGVPGPRDAGVPGGVPQPSNQTDAGVPPSRPGSQPPAAQPVSPRSAEVTVIDDSDLVGWMASATRVGEIYIADVTSMVNNVLRHIARVNIIISRLNILDHGSSSGIEIGSDFITLQTLPQYRSTLERLRGHFASGGFVHLQHCQVGQNLKLISALAAAFGVPVYAGTGSHNPVYRFNFGDYVRCDPNGQCQVKVSRP